MADAEVEDALIAAASVKRKEAWLAYVQAAQVASLASEDLDFLERTLRKANADFGERKRAFEESRDRHGGIKEDERRTALQKTEELQAAYEACVEFSERLLVVRKRSADAKAAMVAAWDDVFKLYPPVIAC